LVNLALYGALYHLKGDGGWLPPENSDWDVKGKIEAIQKSVRHAITKLLVKFRSLAPEQKAELLSALETRFKSEPVHYKRPEGVNFAEVKKSLEANPALMWSLAQMEKTGGAPDIIKIEDDVFIFGDCSDESPDRRDLTYDQATEMANNFGIDMMSKEVYRVMQKSGKFDMNTWSWLKTPADIRKSGGVLFGGRRGADVGVGQDYAHDHDAVRGWRGVLKVSRVSK
jgi:hypothetical protein